MEPLGDELVEDQETVLSLSKNFPALHFALHDSSRAPRDRGADSEPAASQLLKSSPASQQPSSQQVPSPALHRCSTGADQSLTAVPATPSLPTGQNFIFFKKINIVRRHREGKNIGQDSKFFSCRSKKYLHTAQKSSKSLFGRAPPLQKSHTVLACPRFKSSMRNLFFCAASETTFFLQKWFQRPKKTMKLSLIYENRPRGPPTGPVKKWSFWPNFDLGKISGSERKISMIRGGEDPGASSSNSPSVVPLPPVQRTGERNSPPRILVRLFCVPFKGKKIR